MTTTMTTRTRPTMFAMCTSVLAMLGACGSDGADGQPNPDLDDPTINEPGGCEAMGYTAELCALRLTQETMVCSAVGHPWFYRMQRRGWTMDAQCNAQGLLPRDLQDAVKYSIPTLAMNASTFDMSSPSDVKPGTCQLRVSVSDNSPQLAKNPAIITVVQMIVSDDGSTVQITADQPQVAPYTFAPGECLHTRN